MVGCYLCKGHGCDDCFEKECNQITPIFPKDKNKKVKNE